MDLHSFTTMATNLLSVLLSKYSSLAKNTTWYYMYDYLLKDQQNKTSGYYEKHTKLKSSRTQKRRRPTMNIVHGLQQVGVMLSTQSKQTCTKRVPAEDMWLVLHLLFSFPPCLPYHQHLNNLGWWNGKDLGLPSLRVYLETFRGTKRMKSSKGRNNKGCETLNSLECWLSVLSSTSSP